ncbi:MAG: hypothetical protein CAPSK01_004013 [Candidatus Accumulibacter vicinus]|uniref:Uncharacterized protein n=1 Tax=Candidatus Accumulibacter vicinus TaxID=2954382 RepID=A0A084XW04_9PROT|nr:MAG: hypothetical protein CAPSK01_004013 [Candidatus Accumulibacter vicinus]
MFQRRAHWRRQQVLVGVFRAVGIQIAAAGGGVKPHRLERGQHRLIYRQPMLARRHRHPPAVIQRVGNQPAVRDRQRREPPRLAADAAFIPLIQGIIGNSAHRQGLLQVVAVSHCRLRRRSGVGAFDGFPLTRRNIRGGPQGITVRSAL